MNSKRNTQRRSAFTLIEILVATAIMVVLVGLVIQITSEVLKVWNRSSGKLSANAEARIAMDLLTQDLETVVFRNNGQQWLRVEAPVDPGGDYTDQTVALKLFAPALDRPKVDEDGNPIPGDICGIAYRLSFEASYQGGQPVYALYRFIEDSRDTFDNLMGSSSDSDSPQLSLTGDVWEETNITKDENYLAGNIIEFKILVYEDDGTGDPQPVNANVAGEVVSNYAYGGDGGSTIPLLYADIVLTILTDEGMEILELPDPFAGTGYDNVSDVVREHGEVFTRRVNFLAKPL